MIWGKCRIDVLNHCIRTKYELHANLLMPSFQVHRHIRVNASDTRRYMH